MARPRKSIAELKANGSYRKDRHQEREKIEKTLAPLSILNGKQLEVPKSITDKYVQEYYKYHTNFLVSLNILQPSDLPELEMLYQTLQNYRAIMYEISIIDTLLDFDKYERLLKMSVKLINTFSTLAKKYYISPEARTKLELDAITLQQKKEETNSKSAIGRLINKNGKT